MPTFQDGLRKKIRVVASFISMTNMGSTAALMRRGHKVRVLTTASEALPDKKNRVDPNGVPVTTFKANILPLSNGRMFVLGVGYTLFANRRHYEIAQFLLPGLHTLIGVATARTMGKKAVVMFGGSQDAVVLQNSFLGRLQLHTICRLADQIIILNDEMRAQFQGLNFPAHRIISLPCGVDTDEFAPVDDATRVLLRKEFGMPSQRPLITFTGRFVPEKELGTLISAFDRVRLSYPEAMLVLAGDGPLMAELKRQVLELGLDDNVRFTGFLRQDSIRKLLQASDIFTLVSATEGIPCSLVEAMSVGLPSVVSDIAGTEVLIMDGVQGLRVKVRDVEGLAKAIEDDQYTDIQFPYNKSRAVRVRHETVISRSDIDGNKFSRALASRCTGIQRSPDRERCTP
jgi:glycosyltransferase involved in cell wall biosynthesis